MKLGKDLHKNISLGFLALTGAIVTGVYFLDIRPDSSQKVADIIQEGRNDYVERFITRLAIDTSIENGLTPTKKQEIIDLGHKLWKEHGDFPYDIFKERVREKYGSAVITLRYL